MSSSFGVTSRAVPDAWSLAPWGTTLSTTRPLPRNLLRHALHVRGRDGLVAWIVHREHVRRVAVERLPERQVEALAQVRLELRHERELQAGLRSGQFVGRRPVLLELLDDGVGGRFDLGERMARPGRQRDLELADSSLLFCDAVTSETSSFS